MRRTSIFFTALLLATVAHAKDLKAYQDATLMQMDSIQCASTRNKYCREYILETDQVQYRIRPVSEKHATLLPVGEPAQFRLDNTKLLLRVPALDSKERAFQVVSTKPRGDNSADATLTHINHLQ
jgi:hypothetical protein